MSDTVERVARALREWDWIGTPGFAWNNTHEPDRTHWLTMARTAIAAMEGEPVAWQVNYRNGRKIVLAEPDPRDWDAVIPLYSLKAPEVPHG